MIVMESMLRGIPVVASDAGGLAEAKCGTGYVIPVKTIARYEPLPVPAADGRAAEILGTFIDRLKERPPTVQGWLVLEAGQPVGVCQLRREGDGHLVGVSLLPVARNRGLGTALFHALGQC